MAPNLRVDEDEPANEEEFDINDISSSSDDDSQAEGGDRIADDDPRPQPPPPRQHDEEDAIRADKDLFGPSPNVKRLQDVCTDFFAGSVL